MKDDFVLKVVEPGTPPSPTPTPTPVDPGTGVDPAAPNTGLFTHGIGGPEATIIGVATILAIAAIVVAVLYRKHKKQGKVTKLVHLVDQTKAVIKSKKRVTAGLSAIALLASVGTLAVLLVNSGKSNTSAAEGDDELTVDISGNELTVEVGDEPVFAVAEVTATVAEATTSGYTLTAYTDNTDLISTTDESSVVPMVATDEGELVALAENTYGLSLVKPEGKDEEVYTALSTDANNPTFITDKDYEATEANDTTTIYYGFYITPYTPYGTYEGSDVTYAAIANPAVATVTFDGNGLYFNGDKSQTTNTAKYVVETSDNTEKYSHTPNIDDEGNAGRLQYNTVTNDVVTITGASELHAVIKFGTYNNDWDYLSFWQGSHPEYTAQDNYSDGIKECGEISSDGRFAGNYDNPITMECDIAGDSVTFGFWSQPAGVASLLGYGYYAIVTGYDADGNIIYLPENKIVSGDYLTPGSDSYYRFLGWSEEQEATTPTYTTEESIKKELDLTLGETTTLYAVWQPAFTISYNGNGADSTSNMDNVEQYTTDLTSTEKQVDLLASNFKKDGYGFAGWSTDQDAASKINNAGDDKPTIYGPNQMITLDPSASTKLNLYAVWVPAETGVTMQTFNPNSEPYASKPNGTVIALKDERDEEVYAVAKLADGNYWMIENLRLDNEPELSTTNTHNPSLPLTNNYSEGTTSNFLSATSNDWCTNYSAKCYDQSKLNTNNAANTIASPVFSQDFTSSSHNGDFEGNIASYGNYYNWYSATAGNGKYKTGSKVTVGDICPAGWHLPYGGSQTSEKGGKTSGGFYYLNNLIGGDSNAWRSFPNNFVYSGDWYSSSANYRGGGGYYWSSTAYSTSYAHHLFFDSRYVYPGTGNGDKYYGNSVRCVAPVE